MALSLCSIVLVLFQSNDTLIVITKAFRHPKNGKLFTIISLDIVAAVGGGVVAVIVIFIGAAAYTIWWYYLPTRGQREIYRLYPFIDTRWLKVDFPFY